MGCGAAAGHGRCYPATGLSVRIDWPASPISRLTFGEKVELIFYWENTKRDLCGVWWGGVSEKDVEGGGDRRRERGYRDIFIGGRGGIAPP